MKTKALWVWFAAALFSSVHSHAQRKPDKLVPPGLEPQVKQFFTDKEAQARILAREEKQEQVPEIWEFFSAGENGDWQAAANLYRTLRRGAYQFEGGQKD